MSSLARRSRRQQHPRHRVLLQPVGAHLGCRFAEDRRREERNAGHVSCASLHVVFASEPRLVLRDRPSSGYFVGLPFVALVSVMTNDWRAAPLQVQRQAEDEIQILVFALLHFGYRCCLPWFSPSSCWCLVCVRARSRHSFMLSRKRWSPTQSSSCRLCEPTPSTWEQWAWYVCSASGLAVFVLADVAIALLLFAFSPAITCLCCL
jgi:hypothetical protein